MAIPHVSERGGRGRVMPMVVAWALAAVGCGGEASAPTGDGTDGSADVAGDSASDAGQDGAHPSLPADDPHPDCEELEPRHCALPWPPPKFLVKDAAAGTGTGRRMAFGPTTLPANTAGKHIDPAAWNQADGFGVGVAVLTIWPGLDLAGLPSEADLAPSLAADSKIALFRDVAGKLERVPFWVEKENDPDMQDPADEILYLRPAVVLEEARRYVVAFRGLRDGKGGLYPASEAFAALRDGTTAGSYLAKRQEDFDRVFEDLGKEGWSRKDLQLAWQFWTASGGWLHGDMLKIRAAAMAAGGAQGPALTITKLVEKTPKEDKDLWLEIEGTFAAPNFTVAHDLGKGADGTAQTGYVLHRDATGVPKQNGTIERPFWMRVPQSARDGSPHGLLQYGHGLLGTGSQVKSGHLTRAANDHKVITFAGNWSGMAAPDYKPITAMIADFSNFRILPEGLHQGMAEFMLLARAVRERAATLPELQSRQVAIDKGRQFYTGDSQGGIYGTTYVALSQEVTRAVLGVPGHNYSTLLRRSVDFIPYFLLMRVYYPSVADRAVLLSSGQVLWDRVDPVSYLRHLSAAPFPDTPAHAAIFAQAQGDWQVACVTNEIVARSGMGVALAPHYGKPVSLVSETPYPINGSALINWDFGNPWPKPGPTPPHDDLGDPHGKPRGHAKYLQQMFHFFATGAIIDTCGGATCPGGS